MSTVPSVSPSLMSLSLPSDDAGKTSISKRPLLRFFSSSAAHNVLLVIGLGRLVDVGELQLLDGSRGSRENHDRGDGHGREQVTKHHASTSRLDQSQCNGVPAMRFSDSHVQRPAASRPLNSDRHSEALHISFSAHGSRLCR